MLGTSPLIRINVVGSRASGACVCVRVKDVLEMPASGMSEAEILADYDYLETDDIRAVYEYASLQVDHPVLKVS